MIKKLSAFLLMCMLPGIVLASVAGTKDRRVVIGWVGAQRSWVKKLPSDRKKNVWNTSPYNNIVCLNKFEDGQYELCGGTGEFISPKHILTNAHVVNGRHVLDVYTSKRESFKARLLFCNGVEANDKTECHETSNMDFAILEIQDPNFCSSHYLGYVKPTPIPMLGNAWRAGFGSLRVMTDTEFDAVKKAYISTLEKLLGVEHELAEKYTKKVGVKINYDTLGNSLYTTFNEEFAALTGENFVNDYLYEGGILSLVEHCSVISKYGSTEAQHSCHTWPGDSGSSIQNYSNQVVLLNEGVIGSGRFIGGITHNNRGLKTENILSQKIIDVLNLAKKEGCKKTGPRVVDNERVVGRECLSSDLPSGAVSGHYISNGSKKYDCSGGVKCSCAATKCSSGYYLYVNTRGYSMGWCHSAKKRCPEGQHLNVIDGYKTDGQCVDDIVESSDIIEDTNIDEDFTNTE